MGSNFSNLIKLQLLNFICCTHEKLRKRGFIMKQFEDMFFFKLRNLPVIFLQAGKTQEYEDFFCELKKLKKLQLNFLEVKFFQKTNTWIQFCQDSKSSKNMDLFFFAS